MKDFSVSGFEITGTLSKGDIFEILTARRTADGAELCLKTTVSDFPRTRALSQLENEFTIGGRLQGDAFPHYLEKISDGNRIYLAFEKLEGIDLRHYLSVKKRSDRSLLDVGISIAAILRSLEENKVIHKDIKPGNLIINESNGRVYLIDFGLSTANVREDAGSRKPETLEGTLGYISPEQTGKTNWSLDHRTDFYSFGCCLYLFFTGRLPFVSDDPLELLHYQVAMDPVAPAILNNQLPQPLSDLIMKLLRKAPSDRYHTAEGIYQDLCWIRDHWEKPALLEAFMVGQQDSPVHFYMPEKLFGREAELATLHTAFEAVGNGGKGLVFIEGDPGIGKTKLVSTFQHALLDQKLQFARGSYRGQQQDLSSHGIMGALRKLLESFLALDEFALSLKRDRIRDFVGTNLGLLTRMLPELGLIVGPTEQPAALGGQEERNRFAYAVRCLIRALCDAGQVLVLFLDDLHLAGSTSLRLLEEIIFDLEIRSLMVIGAFRSARHREGDALTETQRRLQKSGQLELLRLGPLPKPAILEMVKEVLGPHPEADQFAEFVFKRTDGIPLLQTQLLWLIQERGMFRLQREQGYRDFDLTEIRSLSLSNDLADLVRGRAAALPGSTIEVLSAAAVLGFRFSRAVLIVLSGISETEVDRSLLRATEKGIVISIEADSNSEAMYPADYRFLHTSLYRHFYAARSATQRAELHYRVGELLLDYTGREVEKNPQAFEILGHLNQAHALLRDRKAREELVRMNYHAGLEARTSGNYQEAIGFWEAGGSLLNQAPDLLPDTDRFEQQIRLAEAYFLAGKPKMAEQHYRTLLDSGLKLLPYLRVARALCQMLIAGGRHDEVLVIGDTALARTKVSKALPQGKGRIRMALLRGILGLRLQLSGKRMDRVLNLPGCDNMEVVKVLRLYRELGISALSVNPDLFGVVVLREVQLTLRHGLHPYSVTALMSYAIMNAIGMKDFKTALKLSELVSLLMERSGDMVEFPESAFGDAHFLLHLRSPVRKHLPDYLRIARSLQEVGNPLFAGYMLNSRVWSMVSLGIRLEEVRSEMANYLEEFALKGEEELVDMMMPRYQFIRGLQGAFPEPWRLQNEEFDFEAKFNDLESRGSFSVLGGLVVAKLQLCWLFGAHEAGMALIERGEGFIQNMEGIFFVSDYYLYCYLIHLDFHTAHQSSPSGKEWKRLNKLRKSLTRLYKAQTDNYGSYYELVEAAHARLQKKPEKAWIHLEKAISLAKQSQFTHNYAVANELAFRWSAPEDAGMVRLRRLFNAHQAYLLWGATAKAEQLEATYPRLFAEKAHRQSRESSWPGSTTVSTTNSQTGFFDLKSILKASNVLSREIRLHKLLATLIQVVIENAGAEKGCFVLKKDGQLSLEVMGEMENDAFSTQALQAGIDDGHLPASVVRYVARTSKHVILNEGDDPGPFLQDAYLQASRPASLLCHPVVHQGQLIGIIYLESTQVSQSFNQSRLELLALLSGQIGISLENALLYENLEEKVRQRTQKIEEQKLEIEREKRKSDALLRNILPDAVARQLKETGKTSPRHYPMVSILFSDIVGFTGFAEERSPEELVRDLDRYFSACDEIVERFGLEKVKTIGDAYLCVGGVSGHPPGIHADLLRAAQAMLEMVETLKGEGIVFDIRVGVHTGPVVAGVVGTKKFAYDIWGDAVNIAARMETASEAGRINISKSTWELVKDDFSFEFRGSLAVKNKGDMPMYYLVGE